MSLLLISLDQFMTAPFICVKNRQRNHQDYSINIAVCPWHKCNMKKM